LLNEPHNKLKAITRCQHLIENSVAAGAVVENLGVPSAKLLACLKVVDQLKSLQNIVKQNGESFGVQLFDACFDFICFVGGQHT
jgi:hypothetical protein